MANLCFFFQINKLSVLPRDDKFVFFFQINKLSFLPRGGKFVSMGQFGPESDTI